MEGLCYINRKFMIKTNNSIVLNDKEVHNNNERSSSTKSTSDQRIVDEKTSSIKVSEIRINGNGISQPQNQFPAPKMSSSKSKIPVPVLQTIGKLGNGNKKPVSRTTNSKITKTILEKTKILKTNKFMCQICASEYDFRQRNKISNCLHSFCDSCLRHYTHYKISRFEEVCCPSENCHQLINMEGSFYQSLSEDQKERYRKIHAFSQLSHNPKARLCPEEKCDDGIIETGGVDTYCNKCGQVFCVKCLLPAHDGLCQRYEVNFFENNLNFRQCSNCKAVVEKAFGCNHITCMCGHQFCYLCGNKWLNYDHKCGKQTRTPIQPNILFPWRCLNGKGCYQNAGRIFIKLLLVPVFITVLILLVFQTVITLGTVLLLSILMGLFPYTIQLIYNAECPMGAILFIGYPITMFVGLFRALGDYFSQGSVSILQFFRSNLTSIGQCLFDW